MMNINLKNTTTALLISFAALFSIPAVACTSSVLALDCASKQGIDVSRLSEEDEFTVSGFNPIDSNTDKWIVANLKASHQNHAQLIIQFPGESKPYRIPTAMLISLLKAREITQPSPQLVAMPTTYVEKLKVLMADI